MDRSVPAGGKATASEQMQPLYELKNLVSQQSKQLEEFSLHLQVRYYLYFKTKSNMILFSLSS